MQHSFTRFKRRIFPFLPGSIAAKYSLRHRFVILTVFIVLFPMLVTGIYVYSIINNEKVERISKDIASLIQQLNANIDQKFKTIDGFTKLIVTNKVIRKEMLETEESDAAFDSLMRKINVEEEIKYISAFNNNFVRRVYLFRNKDVFYKGIQNDGYKFELYDAKHQTLYDIMKENNLENVILPSSPEDPTIYLIRNVQNYDTSESAGKLMIDIDEKSFSDSYADLLKYTGSRWFLIDSERRILSSSEKALLGQKWNNIVIGNGQTQRLHEVAIDGETYLASFQKLNIYNMTSIILLPKKQVFSNLTKHVIQYLYIICGILLFSLMIGLRFTYKFTRPILDLSNKIKRVGNGNFNVKMPPYDSVELDKLSTVFNSMTEKIDFLIHDVYQKQLLLKEAELKSLHAQMNPHFMFNVLTTIGLQAKMSNQESIYQMVSSFNQLLQANITFSGNEMITLREELEYIDFYLYLQNIRFEGAINYILNLQDESLLDMHLPKFCIQPLVENAVVHGLEGQDYKGDIVLNIREKDDFVFIEVADNGTGFAMADVDWNGPQTGWPPKEGHNHIGLSNINKRIQLIYGNECGLTITSSPNQGSRIIVRILSDKAEGFHAAGHDRR